MEITLKPTPDKSSRIVASFVMSGFMSTVLSGVFTFLEFGFSATWLIVWGQSILIAWPIAMGLDMAVGRHLRTLSDAISKRIGNRDISPRRREE